MSNSLLKTLHRYNFSKHPIKKVRDRINAGWNIVKNFTPAMPSDNVKSDNGFDNENMAEIQTSIDLNSGMCVELQPDTALLNNTPKVSGTTLSEASLRLNGTEDAYYKLYNKGMNRTEEEEQQLKQLKDARNSYKKVLVKNSGGSIEYTKEDKITKDYVKQPDFWEKSKYNPEYNNNTKKGENTRSIYYKYVNYYSVDWKSNENINAYNSIPEKTDLIYQNDTKLKIQLCVYYLNDEERAVYNYLYEKYGHKKADNYITSIKPALLKRRANAIEESTTEFAKRDPVGAAFADIISTPVNVEGFVNNALNTLVGDESDVNDTAYDISRTRTAVKKTLTENKSPFVSAVINAGLSMGEMATALPTGPFAPYILGVSQASDSTYESLQRGANSREALVLSVANGTIEVVTEKIGLENLFKLSKLPPAKFGTVAKNVVKHAGIEGGEEFVSDILYNMADELIMGEKSQFNQLVMHYSSQGMSEAEARNKAMIELYVTEPAMSFATGAVSGMGYGSVGSVAGYFGNRNSFKNKDADYTSFDNIHLKPTGSNDIIDYGYGIGGAESGIDENRKSFTQRRSGRYINGYTKYGTFDEGRTLSATDEKSLAKTVGGIEGEIRESENDSSGNIRIQEKPERIQKKISQSIEISIKKDKYKLQCNEISTESYTKEMVFVAEQNKKSGTKTIFSSSSIKIYDKYGNFLSESKVGCYDSYNDIIIINVNNLDGETVSRINKHENIHMKARKMPQLYEELSDKVLESVDFFEFTNKIQEYMNAFGTTKNIEAKCLEEIIANLSWQIEEGDIPSFVIDVDKIKKAFEEFDLAFKNTNNGDLSTDEKHNKYYLNDYMHPIKTHHETDINYDVDLAISNIINGRAMDVDFEHFKPGNTANRQAFYETTGIKLPEDSKLSNYILNALNNKEKRIHDVYLKHNTNDLKQPDSLTPNDEGGIINEKSSLSLKEFSYVKEKTGWSDDVISHIRTLEEAEVYINAGLKEVQLGDHVALVRSDIDLEQVDSEGITNRERMSKGMAPYAKNGEKIELHHIGQENNSPLAELTWTEHRGKGQHGKLHNLKKKSKVDHKSFSGDRNGYWKERVDYLE